MMNEGLTLDRFNQINGYNHYKNIIKEQRNFIFEAHLTVDERYFILQDEVFDIKEQRSLGNIWDSIDTFKTIFRNVNVEDDNYKQIQEGWESLPILEGHENLHQLRDILLEWTFFDDTWIGRKMKSAGEGVKDFAQSSWEGIKEMGVAISQGDWSEILSLLKKGTLFILRKLKEATYSTVGIIVDAILVATGIGKGAQMVVWGLITALDTYQLMNNDWPAEDANNPMWMKLLDLGFDILGLVTAGVAAKGARAFFRPFKALSEGQMAMRVAKSPKMKTFIKSIHTASKSGVTKLRSVQQILLKKWPSGGQFIAKILGGLANLIKKLQTWCGNILKRSNLKNAAKSSQQPGKGFVKTVKGKEAVKRGVKSAAAVGGVTYGIEKGVEAWTGYSPEQLEVINKNMEAYQNVINTTYGGKDPFDEF